MSVISKLRQKIDAAGTFAEIDLGAKAENIFYTGANQTKVPLDSIYEQDKINLGRKEVSNKGVHSAAIGKNCTAAGDYSISGGTETIAREDNQTAFGMYNDNDSEALFMIGNGIDEASRSNAFTVNKNGTASVKTAPIEDNDIATKNYVDTRHQQYNTYRILANSWIENTDGYFESNVPVEKMTEKDILELWIMRPDGVDKTTWEAQKKAYSGADRILSYNGGFRLIWLFKPTVDFSINVRK